MSLRRRPDRLDLLDRARGVMLGLAVGDALGAPLEWLHPDQIRARYGAPLRDMVGSSVWGRGEWTDDTAMALCLGESLVDRGGFHDDDVMARYLLWARGGPKDIGVTVGTVLREARDAGEARRRAADFHETSGGRSAGNGSLMRTAPVALRFVGDDAEIERVARADSALTHHDPLAGEACAYLDQTIAAIVRGRERPRRPWAAAAAAEDAVGADADDLLPEVQGRIGFVLTALRVAFACGLAAESFEEAVVTAANLGGDADTNAAVTGAIAGARFGGAAIPERWLEPLRERDRIVALAGRLVRR